LDISTSFRIIFLAILLLISALFSGSEAAFFSLTRVHLQKLEEKDSPRAKAILHLLQNPSQLLMSIVMGNEVINICAAIVATSLIKTYFGERTWLTITLLGVAIFTPLLLLLGEIIPKTLAIKKSLDFSSFMAIPLNIFVKLISPLRWGIDGIANLILRVLIGKIEEKEVKSITEEDFKTLVHVGEEEGVLEPPIKKLIYNVFEFGDTLVSEIMVPKERIFSLPDDIPLDEMIAELKKKRFSRVPIYSCSKDNIIGILYIKDLLRFGMGDRDSFNLKAILRRPYFIPKSKKVEELFREFQAKKIHFSIVIDEYGKVEGIITMDDLLGELFKIK